jgi:hypothetical protein
MRFNFAATCDKVNNYLRKANVIIKAYRLASSVSSSVNKGFPSELSTRIQFFIDHDAQLLLIHNTGILMMRYYLSQNY